MEVSLKRYLYQRFGKPQTNFHITNINYCCDEFKTLIETGKVVPVKYHSGIDYGHQDQQVLKTVFKFALNFIEAEELSEEIYPINFCPFCQEAIKTIVTETEDVSKEVFDLQNEIKRLSAKYQPSIGENKEDRDVSEQLSAIHKQLDKYYYIHDVMEGGD